jgi:hypothetical protein
MLLIKDHDRVMRRNYRGPSNVWVTVSGDRVTKFNAGY